MSDEVIRKLEKTREDTKIQIHLSQTVPAAPDPDEEWAKVMRKLSFKMPQTFKYSFAVFLGIGFLTAVFQKKASRFFLYPLLGTPTTGLGLCYNDFYRMYEIKFQMKKIEKPIPVDKETK